MQHSRIIDVSLPPMSPTQWLGWKLTGLRNRMVDYLWEKRLGIQTRGNVMIHVPDANLYGTFSYTWLLNILRSFNFKPDDVFVDIGCGKGRVTCCAAMFPIRRVVGIDLDEQLCRIARHNAQQMRHRKAPIEIVHAPAQECDYSECTKFFLFNPFGPATLQRVIESITESLRINPRPVELAYVNPAYDEVFDRTGKFERQDQWQWRGWNGLKADVSFWRIKTEARLGRGCTNLADRIQMQR